ncbi:hypothetical protein J7E83_12085 [Arthrobacter sp. ISL-48]|uniref:hypothetical protein n=1 Tax=Arthrobacter sp. ISL-48 TaxID=2819110 RepID=UPI001BE88297|nr:hypothetical protein [Arthrobacter sp. ISL-48]MBT2532849.1 hypothetical protein [Arthrobacter sp. ISL-48]
MAAIKGRLGLGGWGERDVVMEGILFSTAGAVMRMRRCGLIIDTSVTEVIAVTDVIYVNLS